VLAALALVAPEAGEAYAGAEFPGLGLLLSRDGEGTLKMAESGNAVTCHFWRAPKQG
jgi:hypothetical protein